jgi:hypothetical protein
MSSWNYFTTKKERGETLSSEFGVKSSEVKKGEAQKGFIGR